MSTETLALLDVSHLNMHFGGIHALKDVSLSVKSGEITALIGPNGAGKTTLFNCLTGFYRASDGKIGFSPENQTISLTEQLGEPFHFSDLIQPYRFSRKLFFKMFGGSHRIARAGIARTFQNIRLFKEMTALENLLIAQHQRCNKNIVSGLLQTPSFRGSEKHAIERAYHWLNLLNLEDYSNRLASELPYGHQRRLEIARALCTNPTLLCLDEPAAGLNPQETAQLSELIVQLKTKFGLTILLIEHDMSMVMKISDHIYVLDQGELIADGTPDSIRSNPYVIAAYLGVEA